MLKFFLETVNATLQKRPLHLQKARQMVDTLRGDIKCLHEERFPEFWENTTAATHNLNWESPAVPQPRKIPHRLKDGSVLPHSFHTPEELYRQQYFEVMDTLSTSMDCRFSPSAFKHMQDVDDFLTRKGSCKNIVQFHRDDLDETRLTLHHDMCMDIAKQRGVCQVTFQDVVDFLKGDQGENLRTMLPEITKLVKLALTVPVTFCCSERSFSGLRHLKTYLR